MPRHLLAALALVSSGLFACTGTITGDPGTGEDPTDPVDPPPPPPPGTITITSPSEGDVFEREEFNTSFEFVTSPITFQATVSDPAIVEIEYVTESDFSLGVGVAPDFEVASPFLIDGDRTVIAHGRDANGVEVATAEVTFEVQPPRR